jgi:hypothetical protein
MLAETRAKCSFAFSGIAFENSVSKLTIMRTLTTIALLLTMATAVSAQFSRRPVTLSGGLEIGVPVGEFQDTWGKEIFGVSGNLTVPMRILPFDWGFDFAWGRMGGTSRQVPVSIEHVEATTGDLRVNSDMFGYHGLLRLKPFNGKVSPYVEGMLGIRQFTTRTKIDVVGMDQPYFDQRNANEFIWSHGWAAGIQIAPAKMFYFELRAERLNGGQVAYVDPRSIEISDQGVVDYSTLNSGTRVVNVHVGVGLRF